MRIAFITSMDPFGVGGGTISCYRFLNTLMSLKEKKIISDILVLYLGKSDFREPEGLEKPLSISFQKSQLAKIKSMLKLRASVLDAYEKKIITHLLNYKPDVIIVHFSNLGFLTKKIKHAFPFSRIIQNFDNFEFRIIRVKTPKDLFLKCITYFAEKNALCHSDEFIFLREDEGQDIMQFYGVEKPFFILPFTLGQSHNYFENTETSEASEEINVVFTAWFDAYFNKEAALFLIRNYDTIMNVGNEHGFNKIKLILSGHNARKLNRYIKKTVQEIVIVDTPSSSKMQELLRSSDLYISPVFSGEGMKTKILESMYYGIPVVASYTSLRGYEKDLGKYFSKFIFPFKDNSLPSFKESLNSAFTLLKTTPRSEIKNEIVNVYNSTYNLERFEKILLEILKR